MKVRLKRSGGMAGIPREWQIDEGSLSQQEAQKLSRLLAQAGFFSLPSEAGRTGQARDVFFYELTVEEGEKRHTVKCAEPGLSRLLRDFIDCVLNLARRDH